MKPEKLTPLEEKWEEGRLSEDSESKKPTLDDAYTEEGKVQAEGLADNVLDIIPQPTGWRIAILLREA